MKYTLLLVIYFIAFTNPRALAQKQYVCLPCGQSCDHTAHKVAGTCPSCHMVLVEKSSVRFKDIGVEEFCRRITENSDIIILDVRSPEEFTGVGKEVPSFGHFKGAININITDLERRLSELEKYKNKEILVYCSHSHRSPRASYLLDTNGFSNVKNLSGGVSTFLDKKEKVWLKEKFVFHKD